MTYAGPIPQQPGENSLPGLTWDLWLDYQRTLALFAQAGAMAKQSEATNRLISVMQGQSPAPAPAPSQPAPPTLPHPVLADIVVCLDLLHQLFVQSPANETLPGVIRRLEQVRVLLGGAPDLSPMIHEEPPE